jgi:hypothetical protein
MLSHPRGNLIQNPGFELALEFWNCPQSTPSLIRSNVAATARFSHSGVGSALLGDNGTEFVSAIYQDVPVSHGNTYELNFNVAGLAECTVNLVSEVHWLDDDNMDLGTGLAIVVNAISSACDGQWVLYTGITEEAPLGARRARVSFTSSGDAVLLDDILFRKIE